ncbi:unnamed protein product [Euphydryas editha]|uniref:Uncharacterized protein n=1 Tax=Euphydryas editha TaxID=104508 RepID=A0AAU9TSB7_EUPED|nr:unnamed protein product [Euphydryas editha]
MYLWVSPSYLNLITVEEFVRHLARTMFARADKDANTHLHGIAPLHARPPEGRPLTRELLLSPQPSPNAGNSGDEDYAGEA